MKITFELPVKSEREYSIAGLSRKETKQFYEKEDRFLASYYRFMNIALIGSYAIFPVQLFFVSYDVDIISYIIGQTIGVIHISLFIWFYLGGVSSLTIWTKWFLIKMREILVKIFKN